MLARPHLTATRHLLCSLALTGTLLAGCSDDSSDTNTGGGPGASTSYVGLVASSSGLTGPLSITFASAVSAPQSRRSREPGLPGPAAHAVNATGTVSLGGGAPVALTGTLDGGNLNMTGGGWTITGTVQNGQLTGLFTAPGPADGTAIAASSTGSAPAIALCGSFAGQNFTTDPPTEDFGSFSVVIAGTSVLGTAVGNDGGGLTFTGTATASTITINETAPEGSLTATGEYDEFGIGGEYEVKVGPAVISAGSFSGGTCEQPT
ncbi:MAG: hypothetical protein R2910_10560 [Gemmatimonadales bacterium]